MSDLKYSQKYYFEKIFEMSSGYVLNFTDRTFKSFIYETTQKDIDDQKYRENGNSKAKRLREFWRIEPNNLVAKLNRALLYHWRRYNIKNILLDETYQECLKICDYLDSLPPYLNKIEEIPLKSLQDFLLRISDGDEDKTGKIILYRGQNCDKPLLPKIGRPGYQKANLIKLEKEIFQNFKKRCQPYLKAQYTNDWDYLALAQHHNLPTRLLDWTQNPLVALWFACYCNNNNEPKGIIWKFDVPLGRIIGSEEESISPFTNNNITRVYNPNHISERIKAQSGWFTSHYITKDKGFIPLNHNEEYQEYLTKFSIFRENFSRILKELDSLGINISSIFPDMVGLCEYLDWSYFKKYEII